MNSAWPHPIRPQPQCRPCDLRDRPCFGNGTRIFRLRLRADLHAAGEQHRRAAPGRGAAARDRFCRGCAAHSKCLEACRSQRDRGHGARRPDWRSDRHLFPQPARSRDHALDHLLLRRRALAAVAARAGATVARITPRFRSASAGFQAFAAGWRKPAGRRSSATGSAGRSPPTSRAPISCCSSAPRISFPS